MERKGNSKHIGDLTEEILNQINESAPKIVVSKTNVWKSKTACDIYIYMPRMNKDDIDIE